MKPQKKDQRPKRTVIVVMVAMKVDLENCRREAFAVGKSLHGWPFKASMHSRRQLAFVVQTSLTSTKLMEGVRAAAENGEGLVENVWCFTPGVDVVGMLPFDTLTDHVRAAWTEVRKWNNPQNMRPPKAREIFVKRGVKDLERGARVKMGLKPRSVRQAP